MEWKARLTRDEAVQHLQAKQALVYPTETFYGLGALALESEALDRLAALKERANTGKTYPLLLGDIAQLPLITQEPSAETLRWIDAFWPGPLTLVLPAHPSLDARIVGPGGGVAVRLTSHPLAQSLSSALGQPLVSTSANLPGEPPPAHPDELSSFFAEQQIPILDAGRLPGGAPSTIVSLLEDQPRILREGVLRREDLRDFLS